MSKVLAKPNSTSHLKVKVRFLVDQTLTPLKGSLVYNSNDSAFDFEPYQDQQLIQRIGPSSTSSLTIGTLQIEVGVDTSIALHVWGLMPQASWKRGDLPYIDAQPGGVKIALADEEWPHLDRGTSIGLVEINEWPTVFDPKSGWLCIGSPDTDNSSSCVEFASDTIAVIKGDILTAVWLHPKIR